MRNAWSYEGNPYKGLAESVVTSGVIDLRDAFDYTLSYRTTAGSTSTFTFQVSNWSEASSIPETAWSNWTVDVVSSTTYLQPPMGFAYARLLRTVSGASLEFMGFKQIR
jgi:hypothetical protein